MSMSVLVTHVVTPATLSTSVYELPKLTVLKHLFYYAKVTLVKSREKCGNKSMLKLQNGGKREKLILYQG